MTPQQFLESKGVQDLSEPFSASTIEVFLEEYGDLVLSVAAQKAEVNVKDYNDYEVDKKSILNCLKDK